MLLEPLRHAESFIEHRSHVSLLREVLEEREEDSQELFIE